MGPYGVLYHYTDFQALDGILRSAQLRVNNVLNMNDAAEMRHFMKRLFTAIAARLEEEDAGRAGELRRLFQEELKKEFSYSAYAACFSFRRDDAAQWERYGNRGRGVCIAFQGNYLEKMAKGALSLHRVFYRDDMENHPLVEAFCRRLRQGAQWEDPEIRKLMHDAWSCSVAFKHPSFSSEDETRLVVSPYENDGFHVKPCYHVTSERIKKYYPLDLTTMCRKVSIHLEDLITEIVIGPESTQSAPILQDYLWDSGLFRLAERVCLSDCPLRRLGV